MCAQEMVNETKYNEKSDIWALGCLIYEMCALKPPFDASNHLSLAVKINQGKFDRIPEHFSDGLYRAVRWCLQLDSAARPTVEELERLPSIQQPIASANLLIKEFHLNQSYATRMHELKAMEAKVRARGEELDSRELEIARREAAIQNKENQAFSSFVQGHKVVPVSTQNLA
jgi:NIMA (never in mitosis gene a)-related kinase